MASVTPQNWLFLDEYRALREGLLTSASLSIVVGLGPRAFETITGEVVNATLVVLENKTPESITVFAGIDANAADGQRGNPMRYARMRYVFCRKQNSAGIRMRE